MDFFSDPMLVQVRFPRNRVEAAAPIKTQAMSWAKGGTGRFRDLKGRFAFFSPASRRGEESYRLMPAIASSTAHTAPVS